MSANSGSRENVSIIGIIGGIGPQAGIDFAEKILSNTRAARDQDHLNCMLISCPSLIPDRTEFILGSKNDDENPAFGLFECASRLYAAGSRLAVVACNTAHASRIYSPFLEMAKDAFPALRIENMLEVCADFTKTRLKISELGLLATLGTHKSGVYREYFRREDGFSLIEPDDEGQKRVHEAIYGEYFGIKAHSWPISPQASEIIKKEILRLSARGARAIILGCTELPLAFRMMNNPVSGNPQKAISLLDTGLTNYPVPLIDPGLIAARRLIELAAPEKLLPL